MSYPSVNKKKNKGNTKSGSKYTALLFMGLGRKEQRVWQDITNLVLNEDTDYNHKNDLETIHVLPL